MKVLFERKKNSIKNLETGKVEFFGSVTKSKRESAILQKANGGLGRGSLKVVEAFTKT